MTICYNDSCPFWHEGSCTATVTRVDHDGKCETCEWESVDNND